MAKDKKAAKSAKRSCYYGHCPAHNWDGMQRDDPGEAQADLDGHIGLFPDESHAGAGVRNC